MDVILYNNNKINRNVNYQKISSLVYDIIYDTYIIIIVCKGFKNCIFIVNIDRWATTHNMGVSHQHNLNSSPHLSTPTVMFHLRLQNRSKQTMSTLFRTLSVVLLITISYKPSLVLCAAAKNEYAGATLDYLGASSTAAIETEDTPSSYHALGHKGKITIGCKNIPFKQKKIDKFNVD